MGCASAAGSVGYRAGEEASAGPPGSADGNGSAGGTSGCTECGRAGSCGGAFRRSARTVFGADRVVPVARGAEVTSPSLVIGIAGGTGSGKTTLAARIVDELSGHVSFIQQDWYYRDRSGITEREREAINYDEPGALENELLASDLEQLKRGSAVECPQYDFATHTRSALTRRVEPARIIVVEGILLFAVPELRGLFELRIFVDTDDDIRLMRRIRRDILERKRDIASVEQQYFGSVRPMHLLHVAPSRRFAHLIVPEGGENAEALDVIVGRLKYLTGQ
jgi:uridine kinase